MPARLFLSALAGKTILLAKARGERTQSAMEQDKKNASGTGEKEDKGEMESKRAYPKRKGAGRKCGRQPGVARKRTGLARRMGARGFAAAINARMRQYGKSVTKRQRHKKRLTFGGKWVK